MNGGLLRPGSAAAAAALLGGGLLVLLPEHGPTLARLLVATVAASAGLHALAMLLPEEGAAAGWPLPSRRPPERAGAPQEEPETARIRAKLAGRRQRIPHGLPLPPETLRLLRPLIAQALGRRGLDPADASDLEAAQALLSTATLAVLVAEPLGQPGWLRTRRPDPRRVAAAVHAVLDDLERLTGTAAQDAPAEPDPVPGRGP